MGSAEFHMIENMGFSGVIVVRLSWERDVCIIKDEWDSWGFCILSQNRFNLNVNGIDCYVETISTNHQTILIYNAVSFLSQNLN